MKTLTEFFQENKVEEILTKENAEFLQEELKNYCDVMAKKEDPQAPEFKTSFHRLYRLRGTKAWLDEYYRYFNEIKDAQNVNFDKILNHFYAFEGVGRNRVATSFSSKMLATIDSQKPIWDANIARMLNCYVYYDKNPAIRLQCAKKMYHELETDYLIFMKTKQAKDVVRAFRKAIPSYESVSDEKVIDFLIWIKGKRVRGSKIKNSGC